MEELCVSIALLHVCNSGALFLPSSFHDGQGDDLLFKAGVEVVFLKGKGAAFLGNIEMKNDKEGGMQEDLRV